MKKITPLIQQYEVDFASNNNFLFIKGVQYDGYETRYADISLMNNGQPYEIDSEVVCVAIRGSKPDNSSIYNECEIIDENTIRVEITQQMAMIAGKSDYEISVISLLENKTLTSFPFYIVISGSAFKASTVVSSNEYSLLVNKINKVTELTIKTDNLIAENEEMMIKHKATIQESKEATSDSCAATEENISATNNLKAYHTEVIAAENLRVEAENLRVQTETSRVEAETARVEAENIRKSNEETRQSQEETRQNQSSEFSNAESLRVNAENKRVEAENTRQDDEKNRKENESIREYNEEARQTQATIFSNAEQARIEAENKRVSLEEERESNEVIRQTQEATRETNTATAISNANTATENANNAAELLKQITNTTLLLSEWSDPAPYVQTVSVDGMKESYSSFILLNLKDIENETDKKQVQKSWNFVDSIVIGNGTIEATCNFKKPIIDIPIVIKGI